VVSDWISCKYYRGLGSTCQNGQDCSTCNTPQGIKARQEEQYDKLCREHIGILRKAAPIVEAHNARKRGAKGKRCHRHIDFIKEVIGDLKEPKTLRSLVLDLKKLAEKQDHQIIYKVEFDGGDPNKAEVHWQGMKRTTKGKRLKEILDEEFISEIGN
jgi:hypothetical protein